MSWNKTSHPYREESGGGVNNYRVAINNWIIVGGLIWFVVWLLSADMTPSQTASTAKPTDVSSLVYAVPMTGTPQRVGGIGFEGTNPIRITPAPTQSQPTPTATVTVQPEQPTPTHPHPPAVVGYSYYNPRLGGVNCLDFRDGLCQSPLADGTRWEAGIDKNTIAVPPEWLSSRGVEFGDRVFVVNPELFGVYVIRDICTGCAGWRWEDGRDRIDFLTSKQQLRWNADVVLHFVDADYPLPFRTSR